MEAHVKMPYIKLGDKYHRIFRVDFQPKPMFIVHRQQEIDPQRFFILRHSHILIVSPKHLCMCFCTQTIHIWAGSQFNVSTKEQTLKQCIFSQYLCNFKSTISESTAPYLISFRCSMEGSHYIFISSCPCLACESGEECSKW